MGSEITNTALLSFVLVLIGMAVGFAMLRIQGDEE
ncbi:Cytochrome b6-f complex subunit 7 [Halomicronema hongdechloris C2206]|uniref:Cytochrome b6-f complex subunit 7 n=1 Tax=Halomicronema hongdechloris C2206 TaxID=1641165 RepID=A0A1Z3HKI0_9CYAN|nr:PetM family cytochrome b6-f complex subunit 7 [Halomicronema hongdechloris]ASC70766.1 Cytochrome b6-f complex subunit 7 [Halomicronema hongdechloris C2206]